MAINVGAVMDALGVRLATIAGLRVYDYPADNVAPPAAIVAWPTSITFDATYGRGVDVGVFPVAVVVGRASDRASRDTLTALIDDVKGAVDGNLGGAAHSARVTGVSEIDPISVAGVEYAAATFQVEVFA